MALITGLVELDTGMLPGMTAHGTINNEYEIYNNPSDLDIVPGTLAFVNKADPLVLVAADIDNADIFPVGIFHRSQDVSTDDSSTSAWGTFPKGSDNHRQPRVMTAGSIVVRSEKDANLTVNGPVFSREEANGVDKLVLGAFRSDIDTDKGVARLSIHVKAVLNKGSADEGIAVVKFPWKQI